MTVPTLLVGGHAVVQNVAYTGTAAASTAIAAHETLETITVRLSSDQICYYTTDGTTATTANGALLPASVIEYIRVRNGTTISVIRLSSSGTLNIVPMSDITTP